MRSLEFEITCPRCGAPIEPVGDPRVDQGGRRSMQAATCSPCSLEHVITVTVTSAALP